MPRGPKAFLLINKTSSALSFILPPSAFIVYLLFAACDHSPRGQAPPAIKEPDAYRATLLYSYLPGNNRGLQPNELFTLDVARRGPDRQYVFRFGDKTLSYLEGAERHYLIAPRCGEYADTTLEDMNFRIPASLAPEQLIAHLARRQDLRPAGAEQFGGRAAAKYTTPGGELIYVDQATGLPLRAQIETEVSAPSKGLTPSEAKGALHVIVTLRDIRAEFDERVFQLPADMREVEQAALCAEAGQLADSAMQLLWNISDKQE